MRDTKGTFHAKMGTIKDRNGMDLTEAEDIKKRWQEQSEDLYKKGLHDPDNHDSVITHLQPDILECKVKWALGSITTNKASRGNGIPVELFQILKDDAVKVLHSICQQLWKTQQWPQDWEKGQFSFQSQRKAMPKNAQTTTQLHSSHTLAKTKGGRRRWQRMRWLDGITDSMGMSSSKLDCCSPWGRKELDTTKRLKWTEQTCVFCHGDLES